MFRTSPHRRRRDASLQTARKRVSARFRPLSEALEERALLSTLLVDPTNPNDYQTISAAVAAANNGDTIKVAPGTYNEEVTVNKSLTILGAQANADARTRSVPTSQESIVDGSNGSTAFYVTANNVTINGFTVEGATSPNNLGAGIDLGAGTSGSRILDNIVQNNIVGLLLANNSSSDRTVIRDNLFQNNNQPGPASGTAIYSDQFVSGGNLTGVSIASNKFTGNSTSAITLGASVAGAQSNISITGNQSVGDGSFAKLFNTTDSSIVGNKVSGNTGNAAIALGGGNSHLWVIGNSLSSGAGDGILVDANLDSQYGYSGIEKHLVIAFNNIKGFTGSGISVAKDSLTNSLIAANTIRNNGVDGIRIDTGNTGNWIIANTLTGNKQYDAEDLSTGSGTAGTANHWIANQGGTSNPTGLLQQNHGHKGDQDGDDDQGGDNDQGNDNDNGNGNGHDKDHGHGNGKNKGGH